MPINTNGHGPNNYLCIMKTSKDLFAQTNNGIANFSNVAISKEQQGKLKGGEDIVVIETADI